MPFHRTAGIFLMTAGLIIGDPSLLYFSPLLVAFLFMFRFKGTKPLLSLVVSSYMGQSSAWRNAFVRSLYAVPLCALLTMLGHYGAFLLVPAIPSAYWLGGKLQKHLGVNGVQAAELMVGASLVLL